MIAPRRLKKRRLVRQFDANETETETASNTQKTEKILERSLGTPGDGDCSHSRRSG
jgi:hypothetical protein